MKNNMCKRGKYDDKRYQYYYSADIYAAFLLALVQFEHLPKLVPLVIVLFLTHDRRIITANPLL